MFKGICNMECGDLVQEIGSIASDAKRYERDRILFAFESLAKQFELMADEADVGGEESSDYVLAFTAAASSVRRVIDELKEPK
jgi:hypothetical protein